MRSLCFPAGNPNLSISGHSNDYRLQTISILEENTSHAGSFLPSSNKITSSYLGLQFA